MKGGYVMCLITFKIAQDPQYKLILAANRDEAYSRPTAHAQFWEEAPHLLAGKDLLANGTWLGITKQGKLAAITNCHQDNQFSPDPSKLSRGSIMTDYLLTDDSADSYLSKIQEKTANYQPFNVILGSVDHLYHLNSLDNQIQLLHDGIHSVSNASLNTPWPKVERTRADLAKTNDKTINQLFAMMMDQKPAADSQLDYLSNIPLEMKRAVSAPFIKTDAFGTRSTTLILVDYANHVTFIERTYDGDSYSDHSFQFTIE